MRATNDYSQTKDNFILDINWIISDSQRSDIKCPFETIKMTKILSCNNKLMYAWSIKKYHKNVGRPNTTYRNVVFLSASFSITSRSYNKLHWLSSSANTEHLLSKVWSGKLCLKVQSSLLLYIIKRNNKSFTLKTPYLRSSTDKAVVVTFLFRFYS